MVPCQNSPSAAGEKGEGGLGGGGGGLEGSLVALTADRWHSRAKRSIGDVTDVPRAIAPVQGTDAGLNIWPGAGVGPGNACARQWPVTRQEARRTFTAGVGTGNLIDLATKRRRAAGHQFVFVSMGRAVGASLAPLRRVHIHICAAALSVWVSPTRKFLPENKPS